MKLLLVVMAAGLITFGLSTTVLAFHGGGVAHCDGCHTMHNTDGDGQPAIPGTTPGTGMNEHLTVGSDQSSTCLSCHEGSGSYHVASPPGDTTANLTAGGDFAWLKPTYSIDFGWTSRNVGGAKFGHNIIAADFGYGPQNNPSAALTSSGFNGFPAAELACSSCHDPHGKVPRSTLVYDPIIGSGSYGGYESDGTTPLDLSEGIMGNYRLLGSKGYNPDGAIAPFDNPSPIAYATNADGYYSSKVDYGSGMSEWCANCHTGLNADGSEAHRHPASNGAHLDGEAANYNRYVATGDYSGNVNDSYLGLVPFERGETDPTMNLDPESTVGPDSNSNVMCLTCHRAHVGGFQNNGRWDFGTELLAESNPNPSSGGYPWTEMSGYYYGGDLIDIATEFGHGQRSLCNKCHNQD